MCWCVVFENDCSDKDEKILCVILETIGNNPDELKYQRLNVKNLSNILNNCALSLDLLIKFGFKFTHKKSQLTFIGVAQYMYHEHKINDLLYAKKLQFVLVQAAIRACFRANKDTRQMFDSDSAPLGIFKIWEPYSSQNNQKFYTSWDNRKLSEKIDTTLRFKEMCNLNSFDDYFALHFVSKCPETKKFTKLHLYVFNNQGIEFESIEWDRMDIDKLIYDFYRKCHNAIELPQLLVKFDQICSVFLSTTDKDENKINFFKKCVFFLDHCFAIYDQRWHYYQKFYYDLVSTLHKYEYLLNKVSNDCGYQIWKLMTLKGSQCTDDVIEKYMNNIVKPMAERIQKSQKICKYIKNSMLSQKENSVDYAWKCLLCNTKNTYNFGKCNAFCSSCPWNQWNELDSMCPLFFMQFNQSITFGIDPRVKPFYIIRDRGRKQYDCNKYRYIQTMMENSNHLKLSTIVVGENNKPIFVILFEKSNPLTLYELKHLLFEIRLSGIHGENKAKMWTFTDFEFKDRKDQNILNKLSDDSIIDIVEPCYVDTLTQIEFDFKVRRPVEFGKDKFDQGYYHSCCNVDNINNNNINDNNDSKIQDEHCGVMKRVIKPIETSHTSQVFDFEYSTFNASRYHARQEIFMFLTDKYRVTTQINLLLDLVKEVIKNGYETDLLPIREVVDNDTSIDMIDKIVHEYQQKTNTSILDCKNEAYGNYGIFNKFNMGLIQELSRVYKIFDQHQLQSKMYHSRHSMMGYPLSCVEMLALMLYCDGECNYDLGKSQRSHTVMKKWPYFHCLLHEAIKTLSPFEIHYEHIYSGICGVSFQIDNEAKHATFKTNVSFSTDLNVALQFRGHSGMVIGMNMKRIVTNEVCTESVDACDVSWISTYDIEKEILCAVGSNIRIYPTLVRNKGNTQWIALVEDELDHDKAFRSMFGSLAD